MKSSEKQHLLVCFGRRLKYLRSARGLSQLQFAEASGIDAGNYGKYGSGRREPGLVIIVLMARGLGVHQRDLLDFTIET